MRLHVLLDGRDVPERSSLLYVEQTEQLLEGLRARGREAVLGGRGD